MSKSSNPLLFVSRADDFKTDVTLRDLFAAAALTGAIASPHGLRDELGDDVKRASQYARAAYAFADAMLRAREENDGE